MTKLIEPVNLEELKPRRHAAALIRIIKEHPEWRRGCEIGMAMGRTYKAILEACPDLFMYGVEPFKYIPDSENSGLYHDFNFEYNERCIDAICARFPDRTKVLKTVSGLAAEDVLNRSLDFVFIDANHHYLEVKFDITVWSPKVRPGGFIMGHDYSSAWPGVVDAVDELLGVPMQFDNGVWAVVQKGY